MVTVQQGSTARYRDQGDEQSRGLASLCPPRHPTANCSGLPRSPGPAHPFAVGTKSRETICGASVRAAAERAMEARKQADRLAVEA